jgi:hypothetical protein
MHYYFDKILLFAKSGCYTMGASRGRPAVVACALCSGAGGGRRRLAGHVGRMAGWADWLLGRLGGKLKENFFPNKNWIFEYM